MNSACHRMSIGARKLALVLALILFAPLASANLVSVVKSFSPTSISAGATSTLTITITNNPPGNPSSMAFTDTYPAGLVNSATPNLTNSCLGTATAAAGGNSLSLTNGSLSGNSACTITVDVTACTAGSYTNPSFAVTSTRPTVNSNSASLTVTAATASASVSTVVASPTSVAANGTTTSTVTVSLKDGCGNAIVGNTVTLSAGSGSSVISAASGVSNGSGVVTFTVKDSVAESVTYTATDTTAGVVIAQTPTVTFTPLTAPTVAKSFSPASIAVGASSTMTITLTNPNAYPIGGAAFTDAYPSGLVNAATPALTNSCGGTATGTAGIGSLSLTGGTIPATGSCTLTIAVTSAAAASYNNSTGAVTSSNASSGTAASATLTVNPAVSSFNAFETATGAGAVSGNIYTKLAGTAFSLDVVAVSSGVQSASFTNAVTVELLGNQNTGVALDANGCPTSFTLIQTVTPNPTITGGRSTVSFASVTNAWKDVRVRVRYPTSSPTVTTCSTDNFSIRPTHLTVSSSNANNTATSGTPRFIAGAGAFTLVADAPAGVTGYNGTPKIDNNGLLAHTNAIQNGSVAGTFPAAVSGTSTGTSAFTYSEVGNFKLRGSAAIAGSTTARGVYDDTFTSVDQLNDCTADFSNALSGGKYGCKFGLIADSTYFGRFYPADFLLTPRALVNRTGISTCVTTGTIAASSTSLSVGSSSGFSVGDAIVVRGAGVAGADLSATINAIGAGPTFTLSVAASTAVAGVRVYKSSLTYSYEGENLTVEFTLSARNGAATPAITANYDPTAGFAAFDGTTIANFNFAAIDLADATAPLTATTLTSRLNLAGPAASSSGSWAAGVGNFSATLSVSRAASADGPYESFNLGIAPNDPVDTGVILSAYNLDTAAPVGNDHGLVGATKIRYGRMKIPNAYGSELYALPLTITAQYWNSIGYVTNTQDSCTPIAAANFALSAAAGPVINTTVTGGVTLSSGSGRIGLTKPTGYAGKGSVDVATTGTVAVSLPGTGRATFGLSKRPPVIYMRETY